MVADIVQSVAFDIIVQWQLLDDSPRCVEIPELLELAGCCRSQKEEKSTQSCLSSFSIADV
jgi:hypothetical protein